MRKFVYVCNGCGKYHDEDQLDGLVTMRVNRVDAHLDVWFGKQHVEIGNESVAIHFCDIECMMVYFKQLVECVEDGD